MKRQLLQYKGGEIRYFTNENLSTSKPNLILLPGWPVSAIMFKKLVEYLDDSFNCYACNLPGFGSANVNNQETCNFEFYSEALSYFCSELKLHKINILGYSIGGNIAVDFTKHYSNLVDRLILYSLPLDGAEIFEEHFERSRVNQIAFNLASKHEWLLNLVNTKLVKSLVPKTAVKAFAKSLYSGIDKVEPDFLDEIFLDTREMNIKSMFDLIQDLENFRLKDYSYSMSSKGVYLLGGEKDKAVSYQTMQGYSKLIPNSSYVLIPNAEHDVGISMPEEFGKVIKQMLL